MLANETLQLLQFSGFKTWWTFQELMPGQSSRPGRDAERNWISAKIETNSGIKTINRCSEEHNNYNDRFWVLAVHWPLGRNSFIFFQKLIWNWCFNLSISEKYVLRAAATFNYADTDVDRLIRYRHLETAIKFKIIHYMHEASCCVWVHRFSSWKQCQKERVVSLRVEVLSLTVSDWAS